MKQRVVYKVEMSSDKKRSKALSTAAAVDGVSSVKIGGGEEKDKVVVIGDEVDIVGLALTLKKKVGHTCIFSVSVLNHDREEIEENRMTRNNYSNDHDHQYLANYNYNHPSQLYPINSNDYYYRY